MRQPSDQSTSRTHDFDPFAISKQPHGLMNFRHQQDAVSGDYLFTVDYGLGG